MLWLLLGLLHRCKCLPERAVHRVEDVVEEPGILIEELGALLLLLTLATVALHFLRMLFNFKLL